MLPSFIFGIGLLIGFLLIGRWYVSAPPRQLAKALKWACIVVVLGVTVLLALTGRLWVAIAVATTMLPLIIRLVRAARTAKNYARMSGFSAQSGRTSTIQTSLLKMTLVHDSGDLDGEVISGPYSGRTLRSLSLSELMDMLRCSRAHDQESVSVLEAYLDRTHPSWREQAQWSDDNARSEGGAGNQETTITEDDAYRILGLKPGASADDIRVAHHRLISHLHPDRGGSSFLAAQVNRARDLLLRSTKDSSGHSPH